MEETIEKKIECDEMIKLLEDFYDLSEIQKSLLGILRRQNEKVATIDNNIEETDQRILNGLEEIKEAKRYSFRYTPIVAGTVIGAGVGGPFGLLVGLKTISLIAGGIFGGWCGYKIQK